MVELDQLPAAVRAAIAADRFLYARRGGSGYIVREVTEGGRSREREFDESLGRFLTTDERRSRLPPDEDFVVTGDQRLEVRQTHHIDAATGELRARFQIVDPAGQPVAEVTREVFEPTPWRREDVVAEAVRRDQFPQRYAAWSRDDKVRHWAARLHRFRRARGESGLDEDDLYTADLVRDMEKVDPGVRELLGDIIELVGKLEQTEPERAIDAFERRSGISIKE